MSYSVLITFAVNWSGSQAPLDSISANGILSQGNRAKMPPLGVFALPISTN
ncbi:Uncharacterised protein [Mycobacteroides abscessus]|nr:Uncharacterised protein [Mycobacteroides abscessus]SKT14227.1 Uncharacterised protein [Mycobacteroides abscessus subsp. abscessus]